MNGLIQPQLRGPLPLRFHRRAGCMRIVVSTDGQCVTDAADRVLPVPEPRVEMGTWATDEGNTMVPVAVYPSGTEYAIRPDGALVRLGVRS